MCGGQGIFYFINCTKLLVVDILTHLRKNALSYANVTKINLLNN